MCLFNHLSIHPSLYSSINLPIYLFITHLLIKQIIHSSIHLSIYLYPSIHQSIHPSVQISINLSIYLSIYPSVIPIISPTVSSHSISRYLSIHPYLHLSIYTFIPLELQSRFTILSNVRYGNISWLNISSGSFIKDSIRVLLNITGKSYFLRPKPAFPSSGILSVIKVLKLRSPVIKILKLRSPVLKSLKTAAVLRPDLTNFFPVIVHHFIATHNYRTFTTNNVA